MIFQQNLKKDKSISSDEYDLSKYVSEDDATLFLELAYVFLSVRRN